MLSLLLTMIALTLLTSAAIAQPADTTWTLTIPAPAPDDLQAIQSVAIATDGSVYGLTRTRSGAPNPSVLIKADPDGDHDWTLHLDSEAYILENGGVVAEDVIEFNKQAPVRGITRSDDRAPALTRAMFPANPPAHPKR